jgi:hypothetical protein
VIAPRQYIAFNESKTIKQWSEDERCAVPLHVLKCRLANRHNLSAWNNVEFALTSPVLRVRAAPDMPPVENPTPSITYGNATMKEPLRLKFSEPARGPESMRAYSLPSKGLRT